MNAISDRGAAEVTIAHPDREGQPWRDSYGGLTDLYRTDARERWRSRLASILVSFSPARI